MNPYCAQLTASCLVAVSILYVSRFTPDRVKRSSPKNACVNIRVVHCKEQSAGSPQTVAKLDTPADIGARRTALYTDSVSFDAGLPFDHKNILADARDLRTVPGLEKRVLAHYNKVRQMMIDGKYAEYYTTRFITAGLHRE